MSENTRPSLFARIPAVRHFAKAIAYFAAMIGSVVAYLLIGVGFGAWLGAAGVMGWVVGSLVLAGVFFVAAEEAAREKDE